MLKGLCRNQSGFTIVELLVSSMLGLALLALTLSTAIVNRSAYRQDLLRTRLNQNLRSGLDIMSQNMRQAGEGFESASFPAVVVVDGGGASPDEIIVRRNLYPSAVFNLCQNIIAGTITSEVIVAYNTAVTECTYGSEYIPLINSWNSHVTSQGGTAKAFIYNNSTYENEFFNFTAVIDDPFSSQIRINRNSGSWQYNYSGNGVGADVFIAEEFHFRLNNGVLQLIVNGDDDNALNVVDGITNFQVLINMRDGSTRESFSATDGWTNINTIQVTLSGEQNYAGNTVSGSVTARYFPRNILSFEGVDVL